MRRLLPGIVLVALWVGSGLLGTDRVAAAGAALAGHVADPTGAPGDEAAIAAADAAIGGLVVDGPLEIGPGALYDLGYAWQLKGDPARAVGAWRAAAELAPRDGDIAHNLALARIAVPDALPPIPPAAAWMALVTPGELGVVATLAWALASWMAVRARRGQGEGVRAVVAAGAAVALTAVALAGRAETVDQPVAVVVAAAGARIGPDFEEAVRHELSVGSEVRVRAMRGGFALVEDGKGRRGWVAADLVWVPGR